MDMGFVTDWELRSQRSPFNPGGEKEALFLKYCDMVRKGKIKPRRTCSLDVVDNFYVNGDFHYRKDCDASRWKCLKRDAIAVYDNRVLITSF